jgi:hypothetical protein
MTAVLESKKEAVARQQEFERKKPAMSESPKLNCMVLFEISRVIKTERMMWPARVAREVSMIIVGSS